MTARLVAACLLAPCALFAQLELYVVNAGSEQPVSDHYDMGAVEIGETLDTVFRLRNPGPDPVVLGQFSADGEGFSLRGAPVPGVKLFPEAPVDFTVRFQPSVAGGARANLVVNGTSALLLLARVPAAATVLLEGTPLAPGSTVEFGSVELGSSVSRQFALQNRNASPLIVGTLTVGGGGFLGPAGVSAPLTLGPGESVAFSIAWEPQVAGGASGSLSVDHASFLLRGTATDPPFPRPQIVVETQGARNGQQAQLSIRLSQKSPVNGSGLLRMEFQGPSDPAVGFLAPAGLSAPFTVQVGEDVARFGTATQIDFQTGTTAGTIVFSATLGAYTEQSVLQLAILPVVLDSAGAVRRPGSLEVALNGFDNSRTAGPLAFTFLDRAGQILASLHADVTMDFSHHFQTTGAGGLFALRAAFAVTGDASVVDSVDVELTNSAGVLRRNVKMTE